MFVRFGYYNLCFMSGKSINIGQPHARGKDSEKDVSLKTERQKFGNCHIQKSNTLAKIDTLEFGEDGALYKRYVVGWKALISEQSSDDPCNVVTPL